MTHAHSNAAEPTLDHHCRFAQPDDFYQALIDAHQGLSETDSQRMNARLVLLLANQVGDAVALRAVLTRARQGLQATAPPADDAVRA